ncbi:phosphatase PAP2 family protein [Nocardioides sp. URHA0020]|uniref:phosphatase PAP2 family protein n=1 Tax=Nocardioides sp. URHA0020 TaxID=1380392 RepID=UPI0018CC0CBD|nr:phosphatase PAP2 family protein [Nocardioides sp. URHA0020]
MSTAGRISARRTLNLDVAREFAQVLLAFLAYNVGRMLATHDLGRANANAHGVVDVERWLHLPAEAALQDWALGHEWLIELANRYYVSVHFPLTVGVLVWLYRYRRPTYRWAKRAIFTATAVALVFTVLLPVTPPRLLGSLGMVDTGHAGGISIYQAPVLGSMSNEYAAMPSLHVGWALLVAVVLVSACRTRWRWLWLLHPVTTVLVVVSTANHYWIDGIAGSALVLAALCLTRPGTTLRAWPRATGVAQASASSAAETRRWASQISSGSRSKALRCASRKPIS